MVSLFIEPMDWWLEIAADRQAACWERSQRHPTAWARWNAYVNQVCLETCVDWLHEQFPTAQAGNPAADLAAVWEVVNGAVVTIGTVRVGIVPTEAIDQTELVVPQEWVDIPNWAADYYLAVQVTGNQQGLLIYGYATHQQLKHQGTYDPDDRTYSLMQDDLTTDLNALWLAYPHLTPSQTRATLAPLAPLTSSQAEHLIEHLSQPTQLLPRLAVPFAQWGALLEQPEWRRKLYQARQTGYTAPRHTQLSAWLQGQVDELWLALDQLLSPPQLAVATRSGETLTSAATVYRAREVPIGDGEITVVLGITPLTTTEVRINLQIHPGGGEVTLPGATQVRLLTATGEEISQVQGAVTETVQLQFRGNYGEQFGLEMTCHNQTVTEYFVI
jgi:Protein of unknown function (DUF1822)